MNGQVVQQKTAPSANDMAMDRTFMAAERTLMAWIRTSLSMISFGFTIGKVGQILADIKFQGLLGNVRTISIKDLAYFLVAFGTLALAGAVFEYRQRTRTYRAMAAASLLNLTFIAAVLLIIVGGFAFISLMIAR
jgi:putative membrane protein